MARRLLSVWHGVWGVPKPNSKPRLRPELSIIHRLLRGFNLNRFTTTALAAAALSLLAGSAFAESSATATAQSHTAVLASIAVSKTSDLDFGNIVRPAATAGSGTVTIAATSDTVVATSPVSTQGGTTSHAVFGVSGEPGKTFSVSIPTSFNLTSQAAGATAIPVTLSTPATSGTLDSTAGTATVPVGGSFTVTGATVTGAYTGSFDLTVQYN